MQNRRLIVTILITLISVATILISIGSGSAHKDDQLANRPGLLNGRSDGVKQESVRVGNSQPSQAEFARLIDAAQQRGTARVIVGLRMNFKLEGELDEAQRMRQHADIRQVQDEFLTTLRSYHVEEVKQFEFMPFLAAEVDAAALKQMRNDPQITSIEEDVALAPTLAESVPLIGAPSAWAAGFSGAGWAVAILDTGVDKTHPFLAGSIVSEACYSTTSAGSGSLSVCPGAVNSTAANSGLNCSLAVEGCDHGTHVAGIATGTGATFNGVAKDANVIAIQVFSRFDGAGSCGGSPPCALSFVSDQILGLQRVLALSSTINIAAVNMSLGGGSNTSNCDATQASTKAAIDNLRSVNIATVISSGNDGFTNALSAPACISTAVSVGSTGDGSSGATVDVVSSFSNSASFLTLLAPGQWINSSVPGTGFLNFSGTSMAAPHVTGAWAVLKQKAPTFTVTQILTALTSTGLSVTDARNGIVKPRIRVFNALNSLPGGCTFSVSPTSQNVGAAGGPTSVNVVAGAGCAWTATVNAPSLLDNFSRRQDELLYALINDPTRNDAPGKATIDAANGQSVSSVAVSPETSFTNATAITIPALGNAAPYPSAIAVSGLSGNISSAPGSVKVTLNNFSHTFGDDIGVVLVGPTGAALLLQDGCGDGVFSGVTYTVSDDGASQLPDTATWGSGTYKPAGYFTGDPFPAPGPGTTYGNPGPAGGGTATFSSTFGGTAPNGNWNLYIVDFVGGDSGSVSGGWSIEITTDAAPPTLQHVLDFDGDGKTDPTVTRENGGLSGGPMVWYIKRTGGAASAHTWGLGGGDGNPDLVVPADYDGDGKTDLAVWRSGVFFIIQSQTNTVRTEVFGAQSDDPSVVGDYDGDGKADPAVYRAGPSAGAPSFWYYLSSITNQLVSVQWGQNGDFSVPGDFDGDHKNDFVVQRNFGGGAAIFFTRQTTAGDVNYVFGTPTDVIVPGDYDGDGKTDIAIVRGSGGGVLWAIRKSSDGVTVQTLFGQSATDFPAQGDYDGDGKTDLAVWRPDALPNPCVFYWRRSSDAVDATAFWGANGDFPVANYNTH